ncbi:MAG: tetratricopeptide repeat protein [Gammaproteobacteria bacterium]|nr:tetratricopeptide repeat protein [Gammaproteobacteria bacterium]
MPRFAQFTLIAAGALLLGTTTAFAQGSEEAEGQSAAAQETRKTPAMRERVYQRLSEAQACAEMDDIPCAMELLTEVREMQGLNSYEIAQMWNFYAFIYIGQDDFPEAIRSYEMVLEQADLPLGMETSTRFTLCQLYFQQERYRDSLSMLDTWFALTPTPNPDAYILKAQIFYSLEEFTNGIPAVLDGIRVAEEMERTIQENWYRLLNVFYYELEDYPNVINTLRTLIETWPNREYFVQLSAMYGQEGDELRQLALWETAFEAGWLSRSNELVQLAQLLLGADIPVKSALIMADGLESGTIESTETNWRILAQSWQLAQEDELAIPAMIRAADLTETGEIDLRLAQSYQNLARYDECVTSARDALRKGDLRREDQANLILGACLFELKEYGQARTAFELAADDNRSASSARSWIDYVNLEEDRERQLQAALNR